MPLIKPGKLDNLKNNQFNGLLACTRYAFMPNKLQYCGGNKNSTLFEYGINSISEPPLEKLLKEFQTLHPYLKLIANANKTIDIFDYKVIEAYWIGNELLENVNMNKLYWHFIDGLQLKKKIKPGQFEKLCGKIPLGAKPHHSFHVFNVYLRTGHLPIEHTIETMDNCRISWGKTKKILKNELEIETPTLIEQDGKIILSEPKIKKIVYKFGNDGFIKNPQINDWISYHWNWACDILTKQQTINLEKYTRQSLTLIQV